ncbi:hypothetical protein [Aureimonas mangrovi]|uniref:hypothetical protein n=1 Tax=Aureimonas mangrovi TaxID=2758041 RepID=UPI00163D40BA|nr:hypothetical protein [Aureimonas mangrovi]
MAFTRILVAATFTTALSGATLAQTTLVEVDDRAMVAPFGIAADLLDDIDVYSQAGVEIGDVEEIVGPDRQTATHLVVDFDDDDGYPDRDDVIVPIEAFALDANRLVISLTPQDVQPLPIWDD